MKKVLITGSSGYIGQHLVQELTNHYQLVGLDYKFLDNVKLHQVDIRNPFFELDEEYEVVIHLAALVQVNESVLDPTNYYNTNVLGTINLLKNVKFKNFIFASTGAAELLNSPYAVSKKMAEDIIQEFCKKNNKPFTIFRFYNVIGSNGFLPTNPDGLFFNLIKAKETKIFNLYGTDYNTNDGTCIRDYVHVSEICKAIKKAVGTPSNTIENLGHGVGYSVKEIVEKFKSVNNLDFQVINKPRRDGDIEKMVLSVTSKYMMNLYDIDSLLKIENSKSKIKQSLVTVDDVNKEVTLLIKTFLRKDSVVNLVKSIRNFYQDINIVIVDDSSPPLEIKLDKNTKLYNLTFDSGVSYGRNFGITKIKTPYFVTLDDDFEFTEDTVLENFLHIIKTSPLDILAGLVYKGKNLQSYHGNFYFDLDERSIVCKKEFEDFGDYKVCQLVPQFFIAKTKAIQENGWDPQLKTAEHSAFFFDNREKFKVGFTDSVSINHSQITNKEYSEFRKRGEYYFKFWLRKQKIRKFVSLLGETTTMIDYTNALSNLKDLDEIFRKHGVDYWLTDGTLLGYYREKNFISHDTDTDIGVRAETFKPIVLDSIKKQGFEIYYLFGYPEDSFEISLVRNNIKTDIFFFYQRKNKLYHCAFLKQRTRIDYEYDVFKTKEIIFLGHKFFVPDDELKYILTKYGETWKEPDLSWDWAYSPKNHIKTDIKIDLKYQRLSIKKWLKS